MTVKNVRYKVTAPYCSKGCGRERRPGQRYCAQCHRLDQRTRKMAKMTDSEILARAVKKLDQMLKRFQ